MTTAHARTQRTFAPMRAISILHSLLDRRERRRSLFLMGLGCIATVFDVVALLLIVPLVTTLSTGELPAYLSGPTAIVSLPSWVATHAVVALGVACAVLFIIRAVLGTLQLWWSGSVSHHAEVDLIWRLLKGTATISYSDHLDRESGETLRAVTDSVSRAMTLLGAGVCAAGDLILS
ncbi:MAG: hypothetical protein WCI83_06805, partial [Thermoleophilia bacterium]